MDCGHCPIDQSGVGYFMHFLCVFVVAHTVQMDTLLIGLELSLELFYSPVYWPINNWFSIKFQAIPDKNTPTLVTGFNICSSSILFPV